MGSTSIDLMAETQQQLFNHVPNHCNSLNTEPIPLITLLKLNQQRKCMIWMVMLEPMAILDTNKVTWWHHMRSTNQSSNFHQSKRQQQSVRVEEIQHGTNLEHILPSSCKELHRIVGINRWMKLRIPIISYRDINSNWWTCAQSLILKLPSPL